MEPSLFICHKIKKYKAMISANHKRILRNTGMLYIRMLFALVVGLYTSRVVLEVLGVDDFGTYHVVAGFVTLLGFMSGAMTTSTQRYFAYDLGNDNGRNLRNLFNTSLQVHVFIAIIIFLIAETAGYWFVRTKLNIPAASFNTAMTAYHLSIIAFVVSVLTVPLTAMLMAHERMKQFAFMGIFDVFLKLFAILLLPYLPFEKLEGYAALLLCVSLIVFLGFFVLHYINFPAIHLQWYWNKKIFLGMLGFTGWNTWGNLAAVLSEQGNNILLNIFFGPAVNAARTIASQANGALNSFVMNVQAAVNPQIVKLYAAGANDEMHKTILYSAKYNFFIFFLLAIPIFLNAQYFLSFWLLNEPDHTQEFLKLTILASLINSISVPLMTAAQATGSIRRYHTVVGGILLLNVPVSWVFLNYGANPESILYVGIGLSLLATCIRVAIISPLIKMPVRLFFEKVVVKVLFLIISFSILKISSGDLFSLYFQIFTDFFLIVICIWFFGFDKYEKQKILGILKKFKLGV